MEAYDIGLAPSAQRQDPELTASSGPETPEVADRRCLNLEPGRRVRTPVAGIFLFLPLLAQLRFDHLVTQAGYPGSEMIPATSALLSLLALKPVSSGSLSGYRRPNLLLMCLLENPVGRRMVATHARLYLLVPATPGTGCLPPAIAPYASQSFPQALAQFGRRRHRAQQREQRLHFDQLADRHELSLHIGEQLFGGDLLRCASLMPRQMAAHDLQHVVQ